MLVFYAVTATQLINMYNIKCSFFPNEEATLYVELRSRIPVSFVKFIINLSEFKYVHLTKNDDELIKKNKLNDILDNPKQDSLSKLICTLKKVYYNLKVVPIIGKSVLYIGGIAGSLYFIYQYKSYFQRIRVNKEIESSSHIFVGTCGINQINAIKQIIKNTNDKHVCIVDEGTTNYCLDKFKMCLQGSRHINNKVGCRLIRSYYHLDAKFFETFLSITDSQYLYQPTAYAYPGQYTLVQIPPINKNNPKVFSLLKNSVSIYEINEYVRRHVYFLLQMPNNPFEICLSEILSIIAHDELILKEHPEFRVVDHLSINPDLSSVYVDTRSDAFIFEALLTHIDFSSRLIITEFSSAAFTPKFMFDVEPYVVFLYNIIDAEKPEMIKDWEILKENLIKLYRNPEKIYAPKSLDELRAVLKEVSSLISPNTSS